MNINKLLLNSEYKFNRVSFKTHTSFKLRNNGEDKFVYSKDVRKLNFNSLMNDSRRFNVEDYNKLTESQKDYFRQECRKNKQIDHAVKKTIPVAIRLKKYLDRKYKKSDYVFCCIGTSPSLIAKTLEFMGKKVKYFPVSDLKFISNESSDNFYNDKNDKRLDTYQNYLNNQGITNENIESNSEKYIFCDYTYSGCSLEVFKNLMREAFNITSNKAKFRSLNRMIAFADFPSAKNMQEDREYIFNYFMESRAERYGGVAHLPFDELDKIFEKINYNTVNANMFNFLLIDELTKAGYLNRQ